MINDQTHCTRRSVLHGLGALVALPWLESLAAAEPGLNPKKQAEPPRRLAVLFMPNGSPPEHWTITPAADGLSLSKTLRPLVPLRDRCVFFKGICNPFANNGPGGHQPKMNLLTGMRLKRTTSDIEAGISIDQVVAQRIGDRTALPSLVMSTEADSDGGEFGFSGLYSSSISWSSPTTPAPKLIQPSAVFDALFAARTGNRTGSILDGAVGQAQRLHRTVSAGDRRIMDDYLTSVRELEQRIARAEAANKANPPPPPPLARPADAVEDFQQRQQLLLDLLVIALQTDRTRVATYMLGADVSRSNYGFVPGVKGSHHEISHAGGPMYQLISEYLVGLAAAAAQRMAAIREGDGSLLDHTMLLFASSLSHGGAHDPKNLPVVLIGGSACGIKGGRLIDVSVKGADQRLCRLHLALAQRMGVTLDRFGDADQVMDL